MDITTSKFFSDGSVDNIYKTFIYQYTEDILNSPTNKFYMRNIINKTKNLKSSTECTYKDLSLDFIEGSVYIEPNDYIFEILNSYFNSKGDLNTKKAGLILLYINGFLAEHINELNIGDNLLTNDGTPVIEVLKKEIDENNNELGNALEELYNSEPIIKDANVNIRYIYLNRTLAMAFSSLLKHLKSIGYVDPKLTDEYTRLTELINNVRNKYLDSKNHKTKMSAKYIIDKYNIMSYKTYANSYGSASKFRANLRGLIPNDKYYLLNSQYACACGIDLDGGENE